MRIKMGTILALLLISVGQGSWADVSFELGTARLTLDDRGRVSALKFADGTAWPGADRPAFWLETADGRRLAQAVRMEGERLSVDFEGGAIAEFRTACQRGVVVFRLIRLSPVEGLRQFRLFSLPLSPNAEVDGILNAGRSGGCVAAVMGAEPNVHAWSEHFGAAHADRPGCRHALTQLREGAKVGRACARFSATADARPGGWSMSGTPLATPLDLSGLRAIRAWVHGDGQGEQLKIQLTDTAGGARDAYLKIDFTGWRQVTLVDTPYDKLHYNTVAGLNLYFNGLPPGRTVTCLVDHIEAVVAGANAERSVLLEDFESPDAPLWFAAERSIDVETTAEHGLEPACFGVLACPADEWRATIERFEAVAGLPSLRPGGAWNKISPWIHRSYFFLTNFSESQFDEALAIVRRGGFHMILLGQETWCQSTGHYEINRKHFPDGLEGLRRTIRRFQEAGFHVGLHFLGPSIYPPDPYLTPVPDRRLVKDARAALGADIDAKADVLATAQAPETFPAEDGGYDGSGSVLQVGDELVWYAARSMRPPYGFTGCQRGYLGTHAVPHRAGDAVAHVLKSYGYFLFDMNTTLIDEAAANFARVADACGIDMVYFDGSERLQGDHWYYNARLHKTFYDKLANKNLLLQASSFSHYSWHLMARTASADGHGDLKGYLEERSPSLSTFSRSGMPLDIGWYYGYDPNASLDMYEYVLGSTLGYDASMSFQVSPAAAARHPFTPPILDLIARYEKLRLSGRVPEEMKARLRIDSILGGKKEPAERDKLLDHRRDYRLLSVGAKDVFQRVTYEPWHEMASTGPADEIWPVTIRSPSARVGVQVHVESGPWLEPGPSYAAADALTLESFGDLGPYARRPNAKPVTSIAHGEGGSTLPGVSQRFVLNDQDTPHGKRCAVYTAESNLPGPGGWASIGRQLVPPVDLSWHRGIGFWLRGDGRGGQFKLQLRDRSGAVDYYITNNYTGWRYQQLPRPERDPIDYAQVRFLSFYYNGLPGKTVVSCAIAGVKALRTLDRQQIVDPYVELAGRRWQWKGTLDAGQYLVFWPGEPITRYGLPLGEPQGSAERAAEVVLGPGSCTARFGCGGTRQSVVRARITLQPSERWEMP